VYDFNNGQGFVSIGGVNYGAYKDNGDDTFFYGKDDTDAVLLYPSLLESSIYGLLNDYLGRGTVDEINLVECKNTGDCSNVSYCSSSEDFAVCTGGYVCVCSRAHFHPALDEALAPAPNKMSRFFDVLEEDDGDAGISAMYTEPFWSTVGVKVYRESSTKAGLWALGLGIVVFSVCFMMVSSMKRHLQKEKLY